MVVLIGHDGPPRRHVGHAVRDPRFVPAPAKFLLHRSNDIYFIARSESTCALRGAPDVTNRDARVWRRGCVGYAAARSTIVAADTKNGPALPACQCTVRRVGGSLEPCFRVRAYRNRLDGATDGPIRSCASLEEGDIHGDANGQSDDGAHSGIQPTRRHGLTPTCKIWLTSKTTPNYRFAGVNDALTEHLFFCLNLAAAS
jgi:hypothetical protein